EGIARAKDVVAREPKSVPAHIVLGTLYLRAGDTRAALDTLGTATRLDPNSAPSHKVLGTAYQQKKDIASAVAAYKRAIALAPNDAVPYKNAAYIQAAEGKNLDDALSLAQKAQELSPNSGEILDTLGFVHYQRREYQKAEPVLKRATELAGGNPTVLYHLGMTYYKLGRRDEAASTFRRALQQQETIPQAA